MAIPSTVWSKTLCVLSDLPWGVYHSDPISQDPLVWPGPNSSTPPILKRLDQTSSGQRGASRGYVRQTFAMSTGSVAVFVGLAVIGFLFGFLWSKRR